MKMRRKTFPKLSADTRKTQEEILVKSDQRIRIENKTNSGQFRSEAEDLKTKQILINSDQKLRI